MRWFRWRTCEVVAMVIAGQMVAFGLAAQEDFGDRQVVALFEYCDGQTASRIRFIEEALETNRGYARYYYRGWLGFYTIGAAFSSYRAVIHERGERAVMILSAIKAVGGMGQMLLWPPNARRGADASRALPATNDAECQNRLRIAEETLWRNVRQAGRRWDWEPHLINLAIHVAGAVVVGETWGARRDAWGQAVLGEVFGEAVLWTFPWQAGDSLAEYEQRFPAVGVPKASWSWGLAPKPGGAAFVLRF